MMKRFLFFLSLAAASAALADSGAYRVEVIVFQNLPGTDEATVTPVLRSFSHFPDPGVTGRPQESTLEPAVAGIDEAPGEALDVLQGNLPDDLRVLSEKSTTMDDAWRRLRSSQVYRPLLYTGWEQNRVDYYPPMRIHDQQVIDSELRPPTQTVVADLTAPDPLAAYRSTFYQLDGSLQLRRSRFLHLFLDLEFRLPDQPQESVGTQTAAGAYRIHTLAQNRQINTGELQYFDTPRYGVLVYVTAQP